MPDWSGKWQDWCETKIREVGFVHFHVDQLVKGLHRKDWVETALSFFSQAAIHPRFIEAGYTAFISFEITDGRKERGQYFGTVKQLDRALSHVPPLVFIVTPAARETWLGVVRASRRIFAEHNDCKEFYL